MDWFAEYAHDRRIEGDKARVAVTWGYAMHEMIEALSEIHRTLWDLDQKLPHLSRPLAEEHFLKPQNVLALPMIGVMGTTDPRVEANQNAARLGAFFGGKDVSLSNYAFVEKKLNVDISEIISHWNKLDIAIFTCDCVKESFGAKVIAPVPGKLYDQMKDDAVGEIGGMYLDSLGMEVEPNDYIRVGISHRQLEDVAKRGGAILIAGAQGRRLKPVLAALRGHLVSVLVTNLSFAWNVLKSHAEGAGQMGCLIYPM